jgi:hypothetical protein
MLYCRLNNQDIYEVFLVDPVGFFAATSLNIGSVFK